MLKITDGQCGKCAHFGEDQSAEPIVQIRIHGVAPEGFTDRCAHPDNAPRNLEVAPIGSCAGFQPAKSA